MVEKQNQALKDKVYGSSDYYYGNSGFFWLYRWQLDEGARKKLMQREPPEQRFEMNQQSPSRSIPEQTLVVTVELCTFARHSSEFQ